MGAGKLSPERESNHNEEQAPLPGPPPMPSQAPWKPRLRALIDLLKDDSPRVLAQVRGELLRLGKRSHHALRKAARSGAPATRSRARQLLLERARSRAVRRLIKYAALETHDLERGLLLLESLRSPGSDPAPTVRTLDAHGDAVVERMRGQAPGLERAQKLVEYLAEERGISGAPEDYHHPDNIFLGQALVRRRGMPLTLCALYALVARRAGLSAGLLPFPGHVLLRLSDGGERVIVDPFAGGRVLNEIHCLSYLADHGFPYRSEWFQPATDTAMLRRHVLNLINSLRSRRRFADARALEVVHALLMGKGGSVPTIVRSLSGSRERDGSDS